MDTPKLSITRNGDDSPGPQVLHLVGPLVMSTTADFSQQLRAEPAQTVVLDFTEVPFIDSAGLGALVAAHVSSQKTMRRLAYAQMNTQVKALIDMTHVSQIIKSYPTIKEAEAGLP